MSGKLVKKRKEVKIEPQIVRKVPINITLNGAALLRYDPSKGPYNLHILR